jgi:hypothetical protein
MEQLSEVPGGFESGSGAVRSASHFSQRVSFWEKRFRKDNGWACIADSSEDRARVPIALAAERLRRRVAAFA